MVLKSLTQRLRASVAELDRTRLLTRFRGLDLTAIEDLTPRVPIRVGGEITRLVLSPRQGIPMLEVVIADGTGSITAVFSGRTSIGGIEPGRAIILEGVAVPERGRHVVFNPAYTLIP